MKNKKRTIWILIVIISTILIPSIVILGATSWNTDDYSIAGDLKLQGVTAMLNRVISWSPRPFSESLLYIYFVIVDRTKKMLIAPFLGILWIVFFVALFDALKKTIANNSRNLNFMGKTQQSILQSGQLSLLLSLVLFSYFLFIELPSEIFYWPSGAAPYISSILGIFISIFTLLEIQKTNHISFYQASILLVFSAITAFSSEVGAVYNLIQSLLWILIIFTCLIFQQKKLRQFRLLDLSRSGFIKLFLVLCFSLSFSLVILFLLKNSRVGAPELESLKQLSTGNIKISFSSGILRLFKEIFLTGFNSSGRFLSAGLDSAGIYYYSYSMVCKLGLFLSTTIILIWARISLSKQQIFSFIVIIISLQLTCYLTIVAAYYQFGEICCLRHLHFRAILTGISILLLSFIVSSIIHNLTNSRQRISVAFAQLPIIKWLNSTTFFSIVIVITIVLLINLQATKIMNDFVNYNDIRSTNQKNWFNNLAQSDVGYYVNVGGTGQVLGLNFEPGSYSIDDSKNRDVDRYMRYFGKAKLFVYPKDTNFKK